MSAPVTDLLGPYCDGFADLLVSLNIGFRRVATTSSDAPIFFGELPTDPDVAIALNPRVLSSHPTLSSSAIDLPIIYRAGKDLRDVWAMRDRVHFAFAGRFPLTLSTGIRITSLTYGYGTPLSPDTQGRRQMLSELWHTEATDRRR